MNISSPAVRTSFPAFPQSPRSIFPWRILGFLAAALFGAALSLGAAAQATTSTKVTGSYNGSLGGNTSVQGEFSCTGTPTCTGQYREEYRNPGCTNSLVASAGITISGLNLGQSGALQGSILLKAWDFSWNSNADGSCTIIPGSYDDFTVTYTGNWNLATGTGP